MIKQFLVFITFFSISNLYAQDIFVHTGKNMTNYECSVDVQLNQSVLASPLDYRSGGGNFYEIGYSTNKSDAKIAYLVSITYNQFNAAASSSLSSYSWNTGYIGLQNMVAYTFFKSQGGVKLSLNAGLNTAQIVRGEQFTNATFYDITNNEEFRGLVLQPIFGLDARYKVSDKLALSLGYNFSNSYNLTNSSNEKLSIKTKQMKFGVHLPIK